MDLNSQMGRGTLWQSVPCKLLSRRGLLNCISLSSAAMRRSLRQANVGKEERSTQFKVLNGPEHGSDEDLRADGVTMAGGWDRIRIIS